jgi:hypothetical protein
VTVTVVWSTSLARAVTFSVHSPAAGKRTSALAWWGSGVSTGTVIGSTPAAGRARLMAHSATGRALACGV